MVDLPPDYIDPEHKGRDLELLEAFYRACQSEGGTADEVALRGLKAVLALAQPEPEGVTARELQWPPSVAQGCHEAAAEAEPGSPMQQLLVAAGDLLENYARPAIQPVAVAERPWEREGWCDAEGRCWWGRPSEELCNSDWHLATRAEVEEFCSDCMPIVSLPHHALPIPQPTPGS
jgi:hypothetical protein